MRLILWLLAVDCVLPRTACAAMLILQPINPPHVPARAGTPVTPSDE